MKNKFRISPSDIMFFLIIFFFIIVNKFFYLFELPFAGGPAHQILSGFFAIVSVFLSILFYPKLVQDKYTRWIISFFAFIIIDIFSTSIRYPNESIIGFIREHLYFFTFAIYFVFINWIDSKEKFLKFIEWVTIISLVTNILLILNAFLYNTTGNFILKILGISYGQIKLLFRSQGLRIYNVNAGFIFISSIISSSIAISDKQEGHNRILHILNLMTTVFSIYYIEQSRLMLLIIAFTIFIVIINTKSMSKNKKISVYTMLTLFVVFIGWNIISQAGQSILESLSDTSDGTSVNRMEEINYYLGSAIKDPLFGIGLISSGGPYSDLILGNSGKWTFTDVGIFGILGKLGFSGLAFYLVLFFIFLRDTLKCKLPSRATRFGIVISILLCMVTMSFFDTQRIVGLVLAMMYFSGTERFNDPKGEE